MISADSFRTIIMLLSHVSFFQPRLLTEKSETLSLLPVCKNPVEEKSAFEGRVRSQLKKKNVINFCNSTFYSLCKVRISHFKEKSIAYHKQ